MAVNLLYAGVVGLVVCFAGHPLLWPLRLKPLAGLGVISYGIYMYHPPVYFLLDGQRFNYDQTLSMNLLKVGSTVVLAVLSWYLIEQPILSWKDRFAYEKKPIGEGEVASEVP